MAAEMSSEGTPDTSLQQSRTYRNLRLAAYYLALAVLGIALYLARRHTIFGLAGIGVAIFSGQAALAQGLGIVVKPRSITVPRAFLPVIPLLPLWRSDIPLATIKDATALGQFAGFDVVGLTTSDGAHPILFANRKAKLDFFADIQVIKPDIKIYRAF